MSKPSSRKSHPISVGGKAVVEGPLVVPSYSSKALPRISVSTTLERTAGFIVSPVLISAYDIRYHDVDPARFEVPLIIVDSGGYEMLVDEEGRRRGGNADHAAFDWSAQLYAETLGEFETKIPLIAVSYDNVDLPMDEQIDVALAARLPSLGSAFLLKPMRGEHLTIESLRGYAARLDSFDIIGVTEKEAGQSLLERLRFVVRLRALLDEHGVAKPIHVFGALDPIMTPLFFLAGADIVDGITWLRFGFSDNGAHYLQSRAAMADPKAIIEEVEWQIRRANYGRAVDMQTAFRRYLRSGRIGDLSKSAEIVKENNLDSYGVRGRARSCPIADRGFESDPAQIGKSSSAVLPRSKFSIPGGVELASFRWPMLWLVALLVRPDARCLRGETAQNGLGDDGEAFRC